ncbi:GNAT family N-acetyltransferase [Actinorugispora endophytica]|uniref:Acetyltransferase (GNAT) family protein n=1 Tax=Actinorugispora endophytica TaxID=1605990 RepID=A0A4R6V851_9ACTN|nr:GNAT family N-acetyltransferase [Actinorugispora endophytica]TDQ52536.1 acetyltransferase (GNAT) family protein [Actinorugispora endophytica]
METEIELWELAGQAFVNAVPALMEIYSAAMSPPREQVFGRQAIMRQHAAYPLFHSVTAVTPEGDAVGFAYGFHGRAGQWWHDVVTRELERGDPSAARRWFADSFEIAEVHVLPAWQGRGIGRAVLHRLTAARAERAAVLSTHTGRTPARSLYGSLGFVDVLTDFYFPGSPEQAFAIMAAPLPLRRRGGPRRAAGRSHGSRWTG